MANAGRFIALVAAVLALTAAQASARSSGVHVTFLPPHVVQGMNAGISVTVQPASVACTLRVRYSDGAFQSGLASVVAAHGLASWSWTVPTTVQAGPAQAAVRCGRAGSVSRRLVVVGRLVAPRIVVQDTGFSTRTDVGGGTRLSYGVILHDASDTRDAANVTVQTNFVLADDHLLGTDTQHVSGIAAGGDFALGSTVSFPGAAPVVRLEVVVQVDHFAPHALHLPTLANIHLVPERFSPAWLGTIEGEIQNTDPALTLQMASLSAVVFDSSGKIIGGGTGFAGQPLPPGAREFLQLGYGLDVIPVERAASTTVSVSPTWAQQALH
jgi:hypothetical protein